MSQPSQFLSPDPVMQMPFSQGFNRFAYTFNNPLSYVDPSGFTADPTTIGIDVAIGAAYGAGLYATLAGSGASAGAAVGTVAAMSAAPSIASIVAVASPATAGAAILLNNVMLTQMSSVPAVPAQTIVDSSHAPNMSGPGTPPAGRVHRATATAPRQEPPPPSRPPRSEWNDTPDVSNIPGPYEGSNPPVHGVLNQAAPLVDKSDKMFDAAAGGLFHIATAIVPGQVIGVGVKVAVGAGRLLPGATKIAGHHIFPRQFVKFFASRGIDIDQYAIRIAHETTHLKGVHGKGLGNLPGGWNARWAEFIAKNPSATAKEIYQFGGRLLDQFGLSHLPIVPY